MTMTFTELKNIKREAKRMCKNSDIKHTEALKELAQIRGFKSWELLIKQVENEAIQDLENNPPKSFNP